jgi:CheY-like chemotaxis protein
MNKERMRVLLLEDDEHIRDLMTDLFKSRGYEVVHFATPAVCPLQQKPDCICDEHSRCADIILSDLEMPFLTGLQFIENQKNKNCKAPYLAMMSGNWNHHEVEKAKELGCKVFYKPFKISEITEWLVYIEQNINLNRRLTDFIIENSENI